MDIYQLKWISAESMIFMLYRSLPWHCIRVFNLFNWLPFYLVSNIIPINFRGCNSMVIELTFADAINAYISILGPSSIPANVEMYSIRHKPILEFVTNLWKINKFHWILGFIPTIKTINTISLKNLLKVTLSANNPNLFSKIMYVVIIEYVLCHRCQTIFTQR